LAESVHIQCLALGVLYKQGDSKCTGKTMVDGSDHVSFVMVWYSTSYSSLLRIQ